MSGDGTPNADTTLERVLWHEAGHAIMGLVLDDRVERISTIRARSEDGSASAGRTLVTPDSRFTEVMIALAGEVAAVMALGSSGLGGSASDTARADAADGGVPLDDYRAVARFILRIHWPSVERLVAVLRVRRALGAEEIREAVGEVKPRAPEASVAGARRGDWMQTYTGRQFWPLDPRADEVDLDDIAHALAHQCRFAGHTAGFYSVAEHSVRVSRYLLDTTGDDHLALCGLLHDASEAYLVDLPRPVKRQPEMAAYSAAEDRVMAVIAERFGLPERFDKDPRVKHADVVLLATEARDLMRRPPNAWAPMPDPLPRIIEPWSPLEAKAAFLEAFARLQLHPKV